MPSIPFPFENFQFIPLYKDKAWHGTRVKALVPVRRSCNNNTEYVSVILSANAKERVRSRFFLTLTILKRLLFHCSISVRH